MSLREARAQAESPGFLCAGPPQTCEVLKTLLQMGKQAGGAPQVTAGGRGRTYLNSTQDNEGGPKRP